MKQSIDRDDPPACVVYSSDGRTNMSMPGYTLSQEREWARDRMKAHKVDPDYFARPMCIVRLKAWK